MTLLLLLGMLVAVSAPHAQNLLNGPECVEFDTAYNRYLISSWGNNRIVTIDSSGTQSLFYQHNVQVLGCCIAGGLIYVSTGSSPSTVIGVNLADTTLDFSLTIPGTIQLDGMAADSSGYLYVVDMNANSIYKIDLEAATFSRFVWIGIAPRPQSLYFDAENNRLLVVGYSADAPIQAVDLIDSTVSTVVETNIGFFDGITRDNFGNWYVSNYQTGTVHTYDPDFSAPPKLIISGLEGPANLHFAQTENTLAIPEFQGNIVTFLPYDDYQDPDADDVLTMSDNCPLAYNPGQEDTDYDSFGDSCDLCQGYNDNQDADADGIPDDCDDCTDIDGDGFGDPGYTANTCALDNCPEAYNPGQEDFDLDGAGDLCCCVANTGNIDGDPGDIVDMGDLTALIGYLFIPPFTQPGCMLEANVDGDPGPVVDMGDLTTLIDYLFISFEDPAPCAQ